jgi:hypothetical protein
MGKKENQTSGASGVQVFELTMDNSEDQDELNRQLHKPGEPVKIPPATNGRSAPDESTTESADKQSSGGGNSGRAKGSN